MKFGNLINPWLDEHADTVVEPDVPVDASVVTALRARMSDSEDGIRRAASQGLGILRGSPAIPELLQALGQDRDPEVRFQSVRALKKIGDTSVGDRLLPGLNLNVEKVRNEIIITLGALRYREAVPDLTRVFEDSKPADKARPLALSALADIGAPDSRAVFLGNKADKDVTIRTYANEGLARLADASLLTLMSADWLTEKNARVQTAQAFGLLRLGRKEYLDELVRALEKTAEQGPGARVPPGNAARRPPGAVRVASEERIWPRRICGRTGPDGRQDRVAGAAGTRTRQRRDGRKALNARSGGLPRRRGSTGIVLGLGSWALVRPWSLVLGPADGRLAASRSRETD